MADPAGIVGYAGCGRPVSLDIELSRPWLVGESRGQKVGDRHKLGMWLLPIRPSVRSYRSSRVNRGQAWLGFMPVPYSLFVLRFFDAHVVNLRVTFDGQNPVRYIDG